LAAAFIAAALCPTVLMTFSTRLRNAAISASMAIRRSSRSRSVALLLGAQLLGHVGMGLHPAAAWQRPADKGNGTAILDLDRLCFGAAFGRLPDAVGRVNIRIAGKSARGCAASKKLAQRHAASQLLTPQVIHVDVTHIAEDEPAGAVEHGQGLSHVVDRNACQQIAPPLLRDGNEGADCQEGKRPQCR
jgi:hypothetical protein